MVQKGLLLLPCSCLSVGATRAGPLPQEARCLSYPCGKLATQVFFKCRIAIGCSCLEKLACCSPERRAGISEASKEQVALAVFLLCY